MYKNSVVSQLAIALCAQIAEEIFFEAVVFHPLVFTEVQIMNIHK